MHGRFCNQHLITLSIKDVFKPCSFLGRSITWRQNFVNYIVFIYSISAICRSSADTSLLIAHVGKNRIGDKPLSFCTITVELPPKKYQGGMCIIQFQKGLNVSFISILLTLFCSCLFDCIKFFFMALWSCLERRLINLVMYVRICIR